MSFSNFGTHRQVVALATLLVLSGCLGANAPGKPGAPAVWTPANKDGFGTARSETSRVWYTLAGGELTEVYYPSLDSPSVRELSFIVSDGRTFTESELDATEHRVELADARSLTYRQVNTARSGKYRLTKTYVTDPERNTLLIDVRFESLSGEPYSLYVLYDPSLANDGMNDSASSEDEALLAWDGTAASVVLAQPSFDKTSSGYLGSSDGWSDLRGDHGMDWGYRSAANGNVVQMARLRVNGLDSRQQVTLALGFGAVPREAREAARNSLQLGFEQVAQRYAEGWHAWLDSLSPAPASAAPWRETYDVSLMVLAASEDKIHRGAFIASPSMPWVWGTGELENPSGPYHLVWSRDLYQIATGLLAAGDRAGAERSLDHLFQVQQKPDGSFPQNARVDGTPHWTSLQLDEVALPIVLAWQLGRFEQATYTGHIQKAAEFLITQGPSTPQERWENQGGYSPGTLAAEIAGLICAADIARRNGDTANAERYEKIADTWQAQVEAWTVTSNGPLASHPYYLRLTKDGNPNAGTTYSLGDGGPSAIDQRQVVDPSFLELVRLGVKPAGDAMIARSLEVVDAQLKADTPNGPFWRRYNLDGYGEMADGSQWVISEPNTARTFGRAWPIFAGERGEYALTVGQPAEGYLAAMARSGNEGYMLPEQVWDGRPPSGQPGFSTGEGTFSATPLTWSHAQFVRLAWSIQAGYPVEQPSVVACRYTPVCRK
ncbi:glycoside hydrolase family 15 protein [Hyalangium rubrum]|uniref:Glycoside hydrolase family 15 protein n=1 Tax=Hyalangium rubrum TaxID=3103134 RepID=A0ABU5HE21_9BACT|nr:glycoside hydrolase family 15 protein [Hyalangium sp. s54d21]MDY7231525.1 glycoside hydrolase family 15 protein [Hyalangium sp. s54d21]